MFVRRHDHEDVRPETVGRRCARRRKCGCWTTTTTSSRRATSGSCAARTVHAARLLRCAGIQRAPVHADGFYRSGDLIASILRQLHGEGRKKDLINRGGEKISAEEIENLILSHPAVKNVACIAVPDPDLGERMCACIILRDGMSITFDELKALSRRQRDREVQAGPTQEIMSDFPLSTFGKVSKKDLVATVSAKMAAG